MPVSMHKTRHTLAFQLAGPKFDSGKRYEQAGNQGICLAIMDLRRLMGLLTILAIYGFHVFSSVQGNVVFEVQHRFAGVDRSISAFRKHDSIRHGRLLSAIDLPLGGDGQPTGVGLYFTKIGIGSPSKDYYVQVDTGSDILWVNCANCSTCPSKSSLGIKLTLYDPESSSSSTSVDCNDDFCTSTHNGTILGCTEGYPCAYHIGYGDGSTTAGFFIRDTVHFDRVSGNLRTTTANGTVVFGCGYEQSGELGTTDMALDGILGFGQSNLSMVSQLASARITKRAFAHCLDNLNGGGIFAIGEVFAPNLKTTPLARRLIHYSIVLEHIEVNNIFLRRNATISANSDWSRTIIDSGTTLAYLPNEVYHALISEILTSQPQLLLRTVEDQFTCFRYHQSIDDGFPVFKFVFEDSLSLVVPPHDYLFQLSETEWCIGWQNGNLKSMDGSNSILLGDMVLSNKLVVYDLESRSIGWTDYNCSSSIKLKDDASGSVFAVGAHDISSACSTMSPAAVLITLCLVVAAVVLPVVP